MLDLLGNYYVEEKYTAGENGMYGYLKKQDNSIFFPFVRNLYFPHIANTKNPDFFHSILEKKNDYERFLNLKSQRPYVDIYAAFQPFNEAFRALYPFLRLAKKFLTNESVILNLWDRNGWTTTLLKSLFPNCRIVTTWEGNKDVLGYQGYFHWFGDDEQVNVIFCEIDQALPLKDQSIDLVVGMDTLHRYDKVKLLKELDRVAKPEASFIFPHVHLTNAEPEPYFDRGGNQLHGLDYQSFFEQLTGRKGFVFSEPSLFKFQLAQHDWQMPIKSDPNTPDYNALIAILSEKWAADPWLSKLDFLSGDEGNIKEMRVLINPFYSINYAANCAVLSEDRPEVMHLLERHPVYRQQIKPSIALSEDEAKLLVLAEDGTTLGHIAEMMGVELRPLIKACTQLEKKGLVHVLPISFRMFQLQTFMGRQKLVSQHRHLAEAWDYYSSIYDKETYLQDDLGNGLSYAESAEVIGQIRKKFQAIEGLNPGDKIAVLSSLNIENILLFWAATACGLVLVPVNQALADDQVQKIANKGVRMFFTDHVQYERAKKIFSGDVVVFDDDQAHHEAACFSEWIHSGACETLAPAKPSSKHPAVILHTSGSTGEPKEIILSHANLIESGRTMNQHFGWRKDDMFMAIGGLEYMSGLRNATTCPIISGTSVLIPSQKRDSYERMELLHLHSPSIIAGNPAFFHFALKAKADFSSVRLVLCTGNNLNPSLKEDFFNKTNKVIHNYYGLTETCGICLAQESSQADVFSNDTGIPTRCLVRLTDLSSDGMGMLQIWSPNLAWSVQNNLQKISWFDTQDQAKIDNEGRVHIVGRASDVLKTRGEQIIPLAYVQELVQSLDEVEKVVVDVQHINETESLVLFISYACPTPEPHQLKRKISGIIKTHLTTEGIPLILYPIKELPFINGKIDKRKLYNELQFSEPI